MASTAAAAWMEPSFDVDKLSYEIFSILEAKFLFGYDDPKPFSPPPATKNPAGVAGDNVDGGGKVRILSIDGGGAAASDGLVAAVSLARLEASLRKASGDPAARIADFFDVVAGSGAGGVLAAMLFVRGPDGRTLFSADAALRFLAKNPKKLLASSSPKKGLLRSLFRRSDSLYRRIFEGTTLKDAVKPILIPCYDLASGAPFLFSRADAVETDGYDFLMREVCAATCADPTSAAVAVEMRSVDGRTRIRAVGGGLATGNPAAAAITHVLNNRQEFPGAVGMGDLLVVSLGSGEAVAPAVENHYGGHGASAAELVRIAGGGQADMVDQAVAMAFGEHRATNYFRIQASGVSLGKAEVDLIGAAEVALSQRSVESVLFRGKKLSERTNGDKLEWITMELINEQTRREKSTVPTVAIKPAAPPRRTPSSSFASFASTVNPSSP